MQETGLGAHMENTQVYGYDRSKSMKAVWAGRKGLTATSNNVILGETTNAAGKKVKTADKSGLTGEPNSIEQTVNKKHARQR